MEALQDGRIGPGVAAPNSSPSNVVTNIVLPGQQPLAPAPQPLLAPAPVLVGETFPAPVLVSETFLKS